MAWCRARPRTRHPDRRRPVVAGLSALSEYLPDPESDQFPPLHDDHVEVIDSEHLLVHIYNTGGDHPIRWDQFRRYGPRETGRFDHHPDGKPAVHPRHGIWYGGLDQPDDNTAIATSVAEVFQDTRTVPLTSRQRWMVITTPARPLHLLSLDSSWITQAGGNAAVGSGPRVQSRKWARAIHRHYPEINGLTWSSSVYPPGSALMLWEQRDDPSPFTPPTLNRPLRDLTHVLVPAAHKLRYQMSLD